MTNATFRFHQTSPKNAKDCIGVANSVQWSQNPSTASPHFKKAEPPMEGRFSLLVGMLSEYRLGSRIR